MKLQELKKAVEDASADAWKLGALAPEILALVEAVQAHEDDRGDLSAGAASALAAFNAKLEAL